MIIEIFYENGDKELFETPSEEIIVGRGSTATCRIQHESISRKHAMIREDEGRFYVCDFGSANGTFLSDERIQPHQEIEFLPIFPIRFGVGATIYVRKEQDPEEVEPVKKPLATYRPNKPAAPVVRVDKTSKEEEKNGLLLPSLVILAGIGAFFYYSFSSHKTAPAPVVHVPASSKPQVIVKTKGQLKYAGGPLSAIHNKILKDLKEKGCNSVTEKTLCSELNLKSNEFVFVSEKRVLIAISVMDYLKENSHRYGKLPGDLQIKLASIAILQTVLGHYNIRDRTQLQMAELIGVHWGAEFPVVESYTTYPLHIGLKDLEMQKTLLEEVVSMQDKTALTKLEKFYRVVVFPP